MDLLNDDDILTEDQRAIVAGVRSVVTRFDDDYWLDHDETGEFPRDFHRAMARCRCRSPSRGNSARWH